MYFQIYNDPDLFDAHKAVKDFPDQNALSSIITCQAISSDFLVYGDDVSDVQFPFFEVVTATKEIYYADNKPYKRINM